MVYKKIAECCKDRNITISALEKKAGLGNGTIKGWNNSNPRIDSLLKVAECLGLRIESLISDADSEEIA